MSNPLITPSKPNRLLRWMQATNPEKLTNLCLMHLSFLLDLPDNELELLTGSDKTKDHHDCFSGEKGFLRGITRKFTKDNKLKAKTCFGSPLTMEILKLINPIFDYLNCDQNITEGIFRKMGNLSRQKVLKRYLEEGVDITDELQLDTYTPHDCANLLKSFLGELPEPLLAESNFVAYCQVADLSNDTKKLQSIQLLMRLIPKENLKLFKSLMGLLNKICRNERTLMSFDTLATIFVPHLLVPKNLKADELLGKLQPLAKTISFMIKSETSIFQIPDNLKRDIMELYKRSLNVTVNKLPSSSSSVTSSSVTSSSVTSSSMTSSTKSSSSSSFFKMINSTKMSPFSPSNCLRKKRKLSEKENCYTNNNNMSNNSDEITTTITFTDKQASMHASKHIDTQKALSELYAYIDTLPDSAKKRKLMKQYELKKKNDDNNNDNNNDNINICYNNKSKTKIFPNKAQYNVQKNFNQSSSTCTKVATTPSSSTCNSSSPFKYMSVRKIKDHHDDDDGGDDGGGGGDDAGDDGGCIGVESHQIYDVLTPYRKALMKHTTSRAHIVDCNDIIIGEGASINLSHSGSLMSSSSLSSSH